MKTRQVSKLVKWTVATVCSQLKTLQLSGLEVEAEDDRIIMSSDEANSSSSSASSSFY